MALIPYELGLRILFLAGLTNVLFMLLVFFSCRCMGGAWLMKKAFDHKKYHWFYNKHCYFWWGFFLSVAIHTAIAFYLFGLPA